VCTAWRDFDLGTRKLRTYAEQSAEKELAPYESLAYLEDRPLVYTDKVIVQASPLAISRRRRRGEQGWSFSR
jgi:hypothetical protein